MQTAERISHLDPSDNVIYQRHLIAYRKAMEYVGGQTLEIGCGEGYGVEMLAPKCDYYLAIDKFATPVEAELAKLPHAAFRQITVPPLAGIEDNSFDTVVTFQVIEHIEDDEAFVREIARVLKPGGKLVLTTPNKLMSLTRNPWHVREYVWQELHDLLARHFSMVDLQGVFGNKKVMDYYEKNKESVRKITRFDVLNLQYRLPRSLLQIPYDLLNRINRKRLLKNNSGLVSDITAEDHFIATATPSCFDFFGVAVK